ncbi:hypothetical protein Zm00014a_004740 [Zea mays]|uniref:Uncharacterized protein n=1 Tax=Zea mays TaxID=4577 RepID=A0A317Y7G9_MAIZE|nr:hypothetical protein Zm00014a_004740 [Zea mays]
MLVVIRSRESTTTTKSFCPKQVEVG